MKKQVIEYAGVPVGIVIPDEDRLKFIAVKFHVVVHAATPLGGSAEPTAPYGVVGGVGCPKPGIPGPPIGGGARPEPGIMPYTVCDTRIVALLHAARGNTSA